MYNKKADSLSIKEKVASKDRINIYKLYAEMSFKKGNYKEASEILLKTEKLKDSLNQLNKAAKYLQILAEDDSEKFSKKLEINERELKDKTYTAVIIAVLLLVTIVFYLYTLNKNKELKKKNGEIENQKNTLNQKNNELNRLHDERNKLFSIIAHDLRSPFSSILGYLDLLVKEYHDLSEDDKKDSLRMIHTSTYSLHHLVENLLNWAHIQRKSSVYNPRNIDLTDTLDGSLTLLRETAKRKEVEINTDEFKNYKVFCDENYLDLIFRNLLSNAIKFSYRNSMIELGSFNVDDTFIEIYITDYGVGIPEENLSALFASGNQKFVNRGTENEKSSGLGLSLCYEFIKKIGGSIKVESGLNKGSKFSFTVPININENPN